MKRTVKSFALLCMGLFATACVEENFEPNRIDTTPGNDIQFSATAHVGNGNMQTRTQYGDVSTNKDLIEVNWAAGDKITIASPEANGATMAHYDIGFVADAEGYSGSHAATVTKRGDVGLQWSDSEKYTFYAMYPMLDIAGDDKEFNGTSSMELLNDGAVLKGYLPIVQNPKGITPVGSNYIVEPDMRYAYMVAYDTYDTTEKDENGKNTDNISLPFESLSTVLQFQLTAGVISGQNTSTNSIKITSVSLLSEKGNAICGPFKYTYPTEANPTGTSEFDKGEDGTTSASSFSRITMDFAEMENDIILNTGSTLDVTFFLLPIVDFDNNVQDLKLQIFYEVNGSPQYMTATLGVDIQASRKYCFKNLTMKSVDAGVTGSSWFGGLADNILVSQISIPCAGNVFSNESDVKFNKQQSLDYLSLWNAGVRGFELASDYDVQAMNQTFANQKFVVGGKYVGNVTFQQAFNNLVSALNKNPNECLILFARYSPCEADYNPQTYVTELLSFLRDSGVDKERFVRLTPTSTVEGLRGKIAVIIRPGDDDYMTHWFADGTASLTLLDDKNNSWSENVMLVQNWGDAYDRWDMRYEGYTREATWGEGTSNGWRVAGSDYAHGSDGKLVMENYLYGISTNEGTYTAYSSYGYKDFPNSPTEKLTYTHTLANGNTIHVQEWARVAPVNDNLNDGNGLYTGNQAYVLLSGNRYLWVRWPESITQKKKAIDETFIAAVNHNDGAQAYINVLSGYYITNEHKQSMVPYKYRFNIGASLSHIQPSGQGNGGNYAALAAELNTYTYDILSGNSVLSSTGTKLPEGPWGLVMIDFIGTDFANTSNIPNAGEFGADLSKATEASSKLCNLIMMNNFKFPLKTDDSVTPATYNATYSNGGEAISFK